MTIGDYLQFAAKELDGADISTGRLDALVLLEDTLGKDRAWLLAHSEAEISARQLKELKNLLNRRARHEPLAYVRGRTEFYGRDFVITPAVLEPRPESETMIELLKLLVQEGSLPTGESQEIHLADVGTGSGALGITAALELPTVRAELLDIDKKALETAQINVDKFTLKLPVRHSDLLDGSRQDNDVLLCNLPYVPDHYQINLAAAHEPQIAIFGGQDGLDLYRRLFGQLKSLPSKPLFILCESLPLQHKDLAALATANAYELYLTDDFIQVFKYQK